MTRVRFKRLMCLLLAVIITALMVPPTPVVAIAQEKVSQAETAQETQEKTNDELLKDVMAGLLTVEEAFGSLDADTVPEIVGYDSAVARTHIARMYEEEGDNLNQVIFLNADGSRTAYFYDHPVKYIDSAGEIKDISLDIAEADVAGQFETAANSSVTTFSRNVTDGIGLSNKDASISLVPHLPTVTTGLATTAKLAASATAKKIDSKTVAYTYDDKTTLEYSLTYTGFKEDIVVSEYTGQTEYDFTLYTNGLKLTEQNGSFYLVDTAGAVKAQLGDIIIFTADDRNNTMGDMVAQTVVENQEYLLTILVDPEFLADEKTAYPIRIDPTVEFSHENNGDGAIEDVTINSNGGSDGTAYSLSVGLREDYGIARILMKFPILEFESWGVNAIIIDAQVELRDLMCEEEELEMYCHIFSGNEWTETTANWSNVSPNSISTHMSSHMISYDHGAQQPKWQTYAFDITEAVNGWRTGACNPDKGIIFTSSHEGLEDGAEYLHKTLASYNRSSYQPVLSVTYNTNGSLLWDDTYYLNNLYYGDYLRYNGSSSSATATSGLISTLGDSIRWELRGVLGGVIIRSKTDPTKYLAVPENTSYSGVTIVTLNNAAIPMRCVWRPTVSASGGCLLRNRHNSKYLYCDGAGIYTSADAGSVGSAAHKLRVWRILSTTDYGNTSSTTYRELSSATSIANIEGARNINVGISINSYYNNEVWDAPSDFTYAFDNSGVIAYTNGEMQLQEYGGVQVVATHKVTNLTKNFYVLVGFSSTISSTPLRDSIVVGLNQPYNVWPASEESVYYSYNSLYRAEILSNIYQAATATIAGGWLINNRDAAAMLDHFLDNNGTTYDVGMKEMISEWNTAQTNREQDMNFVMHAVEASATYSSKTFRTIAAFEHNQSESTNWGRAVGSYSTSITCTYRKTSNNTYTMQVVYELHDVYDWDKTITSMGNLPVSPRDMWELHHGGMAKNYEVYGRNAFTLTWTKGQTFGAGVLSNET